MGSLELLLSIAVAFAVGLIVGLEREQTSPTGAERRRLAFLGGVRTYPMVSVAGAIAALLGRWAGPWLVAVALFAVMALLTVGYMGDIRSRRDRGLTSEMALLVTFLLGALAVAPIVEPLRDRLMLVVGTGVGVTWLLAAKEPLHQFVGKMSAADVYATLELVVLAAVVLPLTPNRTYGPLDVINPFQIGMLVVVIGGVEFFGYAAIRIVGPGRGLLFTGLLGGLVSSTAVTISMARRAREEKALEAGGVLAVAIASTVMIPRVAIVAGAFSTPLAWRYAIPGAAMLVVGTLACFLLHRRLRGQHPSEEVKFKNPFALGTAIRIALIFAVVLLASKAASTYLGRGGSFLAGAVAGGADMDAAAISMGKLTVGGISINVAATALALGAICNTLVKAGLALAFGGWAFGRRVLVALGAMAAAGGAAIAFLWV